jgi:hypothetical protein
MARLRDILKVIDFGEQNRSLLTLSAGVRLDPIDHGAKLVAVDGEYPVDDLPVTYTFLTQQFWPRTNKSWLAFAVQSTVPANTTLSYRLNDGVDDYAWSGTAWVKDSTNWNTEAVISAHISTFLVGKLRVRVRLFTSDASTTPIVYDIQVGYRAQIVFLDQWIHRTLVAKLRDNIRPVAALPIPMGVTALTVNLSDYKLDTPFDIDSIDSVYNHTTDPDHLTDLYASYDSITRIITLSSNIHAGEVAWINFLYEPEVAAVTSVDYHELAKLPALTIENLRVIRKMQGGSATAVIDKATGNAIVYDPAFQIALAGSIIAHAPRAVDEMALIEEVIAYLMANPIIDIIGTDEQADVIITGYYTRDGGASLNDLNRATIAFEVRWLRAWLMPARSGNAVSNLQLTGSVNVVI